MCCDFRQRGQEFLGPARLTCEDFLEPVKFLAQRLTLKVV